MFDDKEYWRGRVIQQNLDDGLMRAQEARDFDEAVRRLRAAERERNDAQRQLALTKCEAAAFQAISEMLHQSVTSENSEAHNTSRLNKPEKFDNDTIKQVAQDAFCRRGIQLGVNTDQIEKYMAKGTAGVLGCDTEGVWLTRVRCFRAKKELDKDISESTEQQDTIQSQIEVVNKKIEYIWKTEVRPKMRKEPPEPRLREVKRRGILFDVVYRVSGDTLEYKRARDARARARRLLEQELEQYQENVKAVRAFNGSVQKTECAENHNLIELGDQIDMYQAEYEELRLRICATKHERRALQKKINVDGS